MAQQNYKSISGLQEAQLAAREWRWGLCSTQSFKDPGSFQPAAQSSPRTASHLLSPLHLASSRSWEAEECCWWCPWPKPGGDKYHFCVHPIDQNSVTCLHPTERVRNMALLYVHMGKKKDFGGHVSASTTACISAGGPGTHQEVG